MSSIVTTVPDKNVKKQKDIHFVIKNTLEP
jgi:hypothetical protein